VDFDAGGHITGIEIVDASERLRRDIFRLEFDKLPLRKSKL
jgi:uncharacterized protein YuzE